MTTLLAGAVGLVVGTVWLARLGALGVQRGEFLAAYALVCVAYLVALRAVGRLGRLTTRRVLVLVGLVAIVCRLSALALPESDDVYRYLWEGRLQHHGGNPYVVSPIEARTAFPEIAEHDPYLPRVNHPDLTTIYPPLAELVFRAATAVSYRVTAWKLWMLGMELLLVLLLAARLRASGRPSEDLLAYAWHPLPILAFAGEGHMDVLMLLALWVAIHGVLSGRSAFAGAGFASAIGSKLIPVIYLPAFGRRLGPRGWGVALAVALLPTLVYLDAGWGLVRIAFRFGREMAHNSGSYLLLSRLVGEERAPLLALVLFTVFWFASRTWFRREEGSERMVQGMLHLTGAFLLLAPTLHPWYLTWLVPFFVVRRPLGWVALSLTGGLAYLAYGYLAETGVFHLPAGWVALEFGLPAAAVLVAVLARRVQGTVRLS